MSADGLCQCGCGKRTNIGIKNDPRQDLVKGRPNRYLLGHYNRKVRTATARAMAFIEVRGDDECWQWTGYAYQGSPLVHVDGKDRRVARVLLEHTSGEIPQGWTVRLTCGDKGCCNPRHMEAAPPRSKLTPGQVKRLRTRRADGRKLNELAAEFGIAKSTASSVATGRTWKEAA